MIGNVVERSILACAVCCLAVGFGCDRKETKGKEAPQAEPAAARPAQPPAEPPEDSDENAEAESADEPDADAEVEPDADAEAEAEAEGHEKLPEHLAGPFLSPNRNGRITVDVRPPQRIRDREMADFPIPYEPDDWPEPYRHLRAVDALTSEGPARLELTEVVTEYRDEGTNVYYSLQSESSDVLAGDDLSWTFAAAPGVFPPEARIRAPQAESVEDSVAAGVWERFSDALTGDGMSGPWGRKARARLDQTDPRKTDEAFNAYPADFPGDYAKWVTVNLGSDPCLSAAYLVDQTGTKITAVEPGMIGYHCIKPQALADRNGDGNWGVIYVRGVETHPFGIHWMGFDDNGEPITSKLETID